MCDGTLCNPTVRDTANTIKAGCRGIVNKQSEENVVVSINNNEIGGGIDIAHTLLSRDYKGFANYQMSNGVIEWKSKD